MNSVAIANLNTVYPVGISKKEHSFIEKTFTECAKPSHQKETSRRNDDVGYEAALKCLSRQFVTDGPEQAKFTAAKIAFIQKMMNDNIDQDAGLATQRNTNSIDLISAKADAKAKVLPATTELVETTGKVVNESINTTANLVKPHINVIG